MGANPPSAVLHPDVRTLVDLIFEGEDDADATSATLPFDGIKTRLYEMRLCLSRRVLGIRVGFALAVLIPLTVTVWLDVLGEPQGLP